MAAKEGENTDEDFPTELQDRLSAFDDALNDVETTLDPLHTVALNQRHEKLSLIDKAKLDLIGTYAINSLFWAYLITRGQDPKEHGIKRELDRIRNYMTRVKEVDDKLKNPPKRLQVDVAKRFMRNALWQQAQAKSASADKEGPTESSPRAIPSGPKGKHKKFEDDDAPASKKHKGQKKKNR